MIHNNCEKELVRISAETGELIVKKITLNPRVNGQIRVRVIKQYLETSWGWG